MEVRPAVLPVLAIAMASSASAAETREGETPLVRFSFQGGMALFASEIEGARPIADEAMPDPAVYGESPFVGTFTGLGLTHFRVIDSVFLGLGAGRALVLGAGLDFLSSDSLGMLERNHGGKADFHLWSMAAEAGFRKVFGSGQGAEVLVSGMWALGGKVQFQYQGKGLTGETRSRLLDDHFAGGWRLALMGRYMIPVLSFFEVGPQAEGAWGAMTFKTAKRTASVQVSSLALALQMSIE